MGTYTTCQSPASDPLNFSLSPSHVILDEGAVGACMCRVGQNHICTVYVRFIWQGNH